LARNIKTFAIRTYSGITLTCC